MHPFSVAAHDASAQAALAYGSDGLPCDSSYVTTVEDVFAQRPDADHLWPALFSFWNSDLTLSDLTIRIVGEEPTTGWTIFGLELREMALGVAMLGTKGSARVSDIAIEAEPAPDALFGTNLINGVYVEGAFAGNPDPISGNFSVTRSKFTNVADPMPFYAVDGFHGTFTRNTVQGAFELSRTDLANATVLYQDNSIEAQGGFTSYDAGTFSYGVQSSRLVFEGNRVSGDWAAVFQATAGPRVVCRFINNDTSGAANGIYVAEGASGCEAVGTSVSQAFVPDSGGREAKLAAYRSGQRRSAAALNR